MLHFGQARRAPAAHPRLGGVRGHAAGGDVGFAESYLEGHWSTPDLAGLLRLFLRNREALEQLIYGGFWGGLLHRVQHLLRRNTRAGSRKNISAHYDLGNAFYKLWLDPSMNYSSAWFERRPRRRPARRARRQDARALQEAGVQPGQRVLEMGCGWGAVAEMAARDFAPRSRA